MEFWCLINLNAARYGEINLAENYFRVRFEDLCNSPAETIKQIYDFLKTTEVDLAGIVGEVNRPESIGRWKQMNSGNRFEISKLGQQALERFGYWDGKIKSQVESL